MILNFDSTYPERKRRIWGWIWDGENATRGLYYLIITSFTSSKCQINISLSKFERKRSPSIDDRRKKERRRWGAKMQQTWRGERKGERGDEKEKKEKDETPEEIAYRLFHSRSSTPTTAIFLQVLPGKLEIRGSLTRGNRGKIDRLADTMARERDERVGGEGWWKSRVRSLEEGGEERLIFYDFFFFCGFLFIEVKNIGKKVSIRLFNILIRWFILKIIYN